MRRPVLEILDYKFFTPHPDVLNELFKRRFKRKRNADGTRSSKKNKDIVIPVFKGLIRNVIRRLCRRDLPRLQCVDEAVTYPQLRRRYFKAALKVAKKRRANHVQSWRLHNTHMPLIYGNDLDQEHNIANPNEPPARRGPRPPSDPVQHDDESSNQEQSLDHVQNANTNPSASRPPAAPSQPTVASQPVKRKRSEVDFPDEEELKCCDCGVVLTELTTYPKDKKQNEWGENQFRCRKH